jgi:hypothetical protein
MSLSDPIVDEIHASRAEHAEAFDYDVRAIVRELIREQDDAKCQGKVFLRLPGKRCKPGLRYTPMPQDQPSDLPTLADS